MHLVSNGYINTRRELMKDVIVSVTGFNRYRDTYSLLCTAYSEAHEEMLIERIYAYTFSTYSIIHNPLMLSTR